MRLNMRRASAGFTALELMITVLVGSIILAATYAVMVSQQRFFALETQVQDSRESLRAAAAVLAAELREGASAGGDLMAIASDSFALRTTIGFGVTCNQNKAEKRYNVRSMWGEWTVGDSVLVFDDNNPGAADDAWRVQRMVGIDYVTPGTCVYGGNAQARLTVDTTRLGIRIGSQMRPFRWYVYKLYEEGGRYWLGRRTLSQSSYTPVVGPLMAPGVPGASPGLVLTYYDGNGNVTATPANVGSVQIAVRSESYGMAPRLPGQPSDYVRDTLVVRSYLRNN